MNNAISTANQASSSTTIQIQGLTGSPQFLTPLCIDTNFNLLDNCTITIDGENNSINFASANRGFFVGGNPYDNSGNLPYSSSVTLQNMTISAAIAQGGNTNKGGGGAGLGGALFVNTNTTVTLDNVSIENCQANGGSGISSMFGFAYGGGGMGGNSLSGNGGGGGFNQDASGLDGGGCTFTATAAGGFGTATSNTVGAGGGPSGGTDGGNGGDAVSGGSGGQVSGGQGGSGGGVNPGTGGYDQDGGAAGGLAGRGGGAGGSGFVAAGGGGGYVGGGGGSADLSNLGGAGGGGFGGGGGSGNGSAGGGGGGFGGGGGGGTAGGLSAGNYGGGGGGFGGGGGAAPVSGAVGGNGGFGGGGGGGPGSNVGTGGFGGGNGGNSPNYTGGGGLGAGGGIFIHTGGTLNVKNLSVSGNSVSGGSGNAAGSAAGVDFFLVSGGNLNFNLTQDLNCSVIGGNASQGGFSASASSGVTINNNPGVKLTLTTPVGVNTSALFDGVFNHNGGSVAIDSDYCLGASSVSPTINGGTLITSQNITSARNFSIGSNGASLEPANTTTFNITGTLTGANGATLNLAGAGSVALSQIVVNNADNFIITGGISGSQDVIKSGNGMLVLNGTNTYTGTTQLLAGQLQIGDATHTSAAVAGNVSVASNTTLSGHGVINGNLSISGGTVAPGGSIGTLSVTGNFTADASTNVQIEISPSEASLLQINGTASLNGGDLTLDFDAGSYNTKTFNIITANSITGTFNNVIKNNLPTNTTALINYLNNSIQLVLKSLNSSFASRATSSLGFIVGEFMDNVASSSPTTEQQQLINALNATTNDDLLNTYLVQIAPIITQPLNTINMYFLQQQQIENRLSSLHTNYYNAGDNWNTNGVWIQPLYDDSKQNNRGNLLGYRAHTTGIMVGADREINPSIMLGIAGSYSFAIQKSLLNANTYTKVKNYLGILYGTAYFKNCVQLDLLAAGGRNNYSGSRVVDVSPINVTATSKYNGAQYSSQAVISKHITANNFYITPQVNADYVYLRQPAYSEQGAGTLGMSVNASNSSVFSMGTGLQVKFKQQWHNSVLQPEVHALVYSDLKNANINSSATFISGGPVLATQAAPGRITGQFGTSLSLDVTDKMSFKASYDLLTKSKYYNNIVYVTLRYVF